MEFNLNDNAVAIDVKDSATIEFEGGKVDFNLTTDPIDFKLENSETEINFLHQTIVNNDYEPLKNKPSINGVELVGDKTTEDLRIEIPEVDLSNYYNKKEVDNKIENIEIPEVDLSNYYNKEETNELLNNKLDKFYVNYNINPQTMEIVSISHYSEEIINAYNEGKQVTFIGTILGLNIPIISHLNIVQGDVAISHPTFRFDLGMGMMSLLATISVLPSEVYLEVVQLKEENGQNDSEFYDVYYYISITANGVSIDHITRYSEELIEAYNEGKQVRFIGLAYGRSVPIISMLQVVQGNMVFTYPTIKTDLGQGMKNYLFTVSVSTDSVSLGISELAEMKDLQNQYWAIYEEFMNILSVSLDGVRLNHMALDPHPPATAPEGAILKFIDGKWQAVVE